MAGRGEEAEAEDEEEQRRLAAESLQCYAYLCDATEATLGFGISLAFNGATLVNARSPFEFLSLDAFVGIPEDEEDEGEEASADGEQDPDEEGFLSAEEEEERQGEGGDEEPEPQEWECSVCGFLNHPRSTACRRCRAAAPRQDLVRLLPAQTARRLGVRQNKCGTEGFTHFLPLYISREHWRRGLCSRCLLAAWCRVPLERIPQEIRPGVEADAVWHVLPALMNSTAVAMMGGELHMSDVSLRGYYNLHRLFLELVSPELRAKAEVAVVSFAEDPECRLKSFCPNLGHFLPRLLLVREPLAAWRRIQEPLLQETIDRTALHALREYPGLAQEVPEEYARMRWASAAKGLRMMLFSVRFLRRAARWGSLESVAQHYDQLYGQPSGRERDAFRYEVREILAVDSWEAFSERWLAEAGSSGGGGEAPSFARALGGEGLEALVERLRESEERSAAKGYHTPPAAAAAAAAKAAAEAAAATAAAVPPPAGGE